MSRYHRHQSARRRHVTSRLVTQPQEFCFEEKFDTWLDLEPMFRAVHYLSLVDTWNTSNMKPMNHVIGPDSCCDLRLAGLKPSDLQHMILTPTIPAKLHHTMLHKSSKISHWGPKRERLLVSQIKEASSIVIDEQLNHLTKNMSPTLQLNALSSTQPWLTKLASWPDKLLDAWRWAEDWHRLISIYRKHNQFIPLKSPYKRAVRRKQSGFTQCDLPSYKAQAIISRDVVLLLLSGKWYILTKDLLLECYNKVTEMSNILLFNYLQAGTCLPDNQYDVVIAFLSHLSKRVTKYGGKPVSRVQFNHDNKGFTYLKMMEGIGVAELILRSDARRGWMNDDLIKTLWFTVYEERLDPSEDYKLSELCLILQLCSEPQIADIVGLVKLMGHPTIEVEKGLHKLYERTHKNIVVDPAAVQRSLGVFMRDLFLNFYRRHKHYPTCEARADVCGQTLGVLINNQVDPVTPRGRELWARVTILQWSHVILHKNEEFDPVDNQIMLLKDKAIGVTRSKVLKNVIAGVDECDMVDTFGSPTQSGSIAERRALINFLLSTDYSQRFKAYLDAYQNEEPWTAAVLDYLVIKLTPKEGEEKPEGRMFGASPDVFRNSRIVQELNTHRFMHKYTPEQLMTPNELLMIRKMYSFRHMVDLYPHHTIFQMSYDFSAWNNSMRAAGVDILGRQTLDRWFNVKIFGKTMMAYLNSLFLFHCPWLLMYWLGQPGGIEGLNQDTWVLFFIAAIKSILEGIGCIYQLTAKGDDIRAAIAVPNNTLIPTVQVPNPLKNFKDRILRELQALCDQMGWALKPEESFVSLSVIATSKQYQVNNTWLPAASKKIMKIESLANLVFPTIEDIISNVYSVCHSACSQTTVFLPAYTTATVTAIKILAREHINSRISPEFLAINCMWPQILSGPGGLPMQMFFVRGENDVLSIAISLFRSLIQSNRTHIATFAKRILQQSFEADTDHALLIADPYSIPINAPPRPSTVLKRLMRVRMKHWVKNRDIKTLLTIEAEQDAKRLKETLLSMRPYVAKVATVIWEASPFYLIDEILNKFINSTSIIVFLSTTKSGKFVKKLGLSQIARVANAAVKRLEYWSTIVSHDNILVQELLGVPQAIWDNPNTCTTMIAHKVRQAAWGFQIVGITYPSLVDQNLLIHPDDLVVVSENIEIEGNTSLVTIMTGSSQFQTDLESHHYSAVEGHVPWIGARTSTKISFHNLDVDISSSCVSKIMKLIALETSGSYLGASFRSVVRSVLSSLTNLSMTQLLLLTPEAPGGHIAHRVQTNSYSLTTMPNSRPNIAQITHVDDDNLMVIKKDNLNRTLNFAARSYYLIAISTFCLQSQQLIPPEWPRKVLCMLHYDIENLPKFSLCPWCLNVVEDEKIDFEIPLSYDLMKYNQLPLVGTSEFDQQTLRKAIDDSIKDKAMRAIRFHTSQDVNPITLSNASRLIVQKFVRENSRVFMEAQAAGYERVPQGTLLEVMSVAMGLGDIGSSSVSINLLRCMPPDVLYEHITFSVFTWFLSWFVTKEDVSQVSDMFELQSHLDVFSPVFNTLATAGVLQALTIGCSRKQYITQPLVWPHASSINGHVASRYFMSVHHEVFLQWVHGDDRPPNVKIFVNMEDHHSILGYLEDESAKVMQILLWRLTHTFTVDSLRHGISHLYKLCQRQLNFPDIKDYNVDQVNWQRFVYFFAYLITNPPEYTRDEYIAIVSCCEVIRWIPYIIIKGTWSEDDEATIMEGSARKTLIQVDYDQVVPVDRSIIVPLVNHHALNWLNPLKHERGKSFVWDLCIMCTQRVAVRETVEQTANQVLTRVMESIQWLNERHLALLTLEDAERIVKSQPLELRHYDTEDIDEPDDREITEAAFMWATDCPLDHHIMTGQPTDIIPITRSDFLREQFDQVRLHGFINRAALNNFYIPGIGPSDWVRNFGGINRSVLKWIDVFNSSGLMNSFLSTLPPQHAWLIGDGGGGISRYLIRLIPQIQIMICTLARMPGSHTPKTDAPINNPPYEFMGPHVKMSEINRLDWQTCYPGDIRDPIVTAQIQSAKKFKECAFDLIISDVDCNTTQPAEAYASTMWSVIEKSYNLGSRDHILCLKVMLLDHFLVYHLLYNIHMLYRHVHMIRSRASRPYFPEVFIIASEKQPDRYHHNLFPDLRSGDHTMGLHVEILAQVAQLTGEIMSICHDYKCLLLYRPRDTLEVLASCWEYMIIPQDVHFLSRSLDIDGDWVVHHYCQVFMYSTEKLYAKLSYTNSTWTRHYTRGNLSVPPQRDARAQSIKGAKGHVVAKGISGLINALGRYLTALFIYSVIEKFGAQFELITPVYAHDTLTTFWISLSQIMFTSALPLRLLWCQGQIFVVVQGITLNVNRIMHQCYKSTEQLVGWLCIIAKYHQNLSVEQFQQVVNQMHPVITTDECCHAQMDIFSQLKDSHEDILRAQPILFAPDFTEVSYDCTVYPRFDGVRERWTGLVEQLIPGQHHLQNAFDQKEILRCVKGLSDRFPVLDVHPALTNLFGHLPLLLTDIVEVQAGEEIEARFGELDWADEVEAHFGEYN